MLVLPLVLILFAFLIGSIVGSFLNVAIMRGERGEHLTGRSHCENCGTILSIRELIPLVSFVYQKGRCRNCDIVLSVQYPFVELIGGITFAGIVYYSIACTPFVWDMSLFVTVMTLFAAASAMILIVVADLKYHIIPNGAVLLLFLLDIGVLLIRNGFICFPGSTICAAGSIHGMMLDIAASIMFTLFFFAVWFFSRGNALGFGDVKLIGVSSLLVGFPLSLVAFLVSFWLGGIAGIVLLLTKKRELKSQIAFGPFIIAGVSLAYLFGAQFLAASGFEFLDYVL